MEMPFAWTLGIRPSRIPFAVSLEVRAEFPLAVGLPRPATRRVSSATHGGARMRFAISIPQFVSDGTFNPAAFRAYMARAETLGFDSAWTQEQVLGSMPHLGPIEILTYAAACT